MKFTEQEMKEISNIQSEYQDKILQLGQISFEKILLTKKLEQLDTDENTIKNDIKTTQNKEIKLIEDLQKKYGAGTINIQTGEFTPAT